MSVNKQAEVLRDITYAAFQTHYNSTKQPGWSDAFEHWQTNEQARLLWTSLVKGIVINVGNAQAQGLLPPLVGVEPKPTALPGLGAPDTSPGGLARRLADSLRGRQAASEARRQSAQAAADARGPDGIPPGYHDTVPGLAVGRCTGDEPGDASGCSDSGSDSGSGDGGGGGGD